MEDYHTMKNAEGFQPKYTEDSGLKFEDKMSTSPAAASSKI
jgi:hypothetical protein